MPLVIHVLRKFEPEAWGGIETHLLALIPELRKRGWESEVHAPREAGTDGSAIERAGAAFRTFRAHYPSLGLTAEKRKALVATGGNLVAPGELARLVADRRADVLHAHTLRRLGGVVRTAARVRRIPYAVTLHGPVRTDVAGIARDAQSRMRGTVDLGAPFGWLVGARRVVEDADLVYAFNRDEEEAWRKDRDGRHLARVAHGVSTERATAQEIAKARASIGALGDARYAVVVARLDPAKGPDVAVAAFRKAAPPDLHLVLAGAAVDPSYAEKVRALAEGDARIHVVGGVPPKTARALLAGAAFSIVPSRSEPFGIVLLEAWAEGTPALFVEVGGLAEIARTTGATWGKVARSDADVLAARITEALADEAGRRREGEEARARVAAHYSWGALADRMVEDYEAARRPAK